MAHRCALTVLALLSFCDVSIADPFPRGFSPNPLNGSTKPVTKDGTTTFHINHGECSSFEYNDSRHESDCVNGNVRATIIHQPLVKLGGSMEYAFEFKIEKPFVYGGFYNDMALAFIPDGWDSHFSIASWEGNRIHDHLYSLKVSSRKGAVIAGKECQAPDKIGEWQNFKLSAKWDSNKAGWVKIECGGRVIYIEEAFDSDQPIQCYLQNVCDPALDNRPDKFQFWLGPVMAGEGYEWKKIGKPSKYVEIQQGGITVQMRNISVLPVKGLYDADHTALALQLENRLSELGCDPGKIDGKVTSETKIAALNCRVFDKGVLPEALNFTTIGKFVAVFSAPGVDKLPVKEKPVTASNWKITVTQGKESFSSGDFVDSWFTGQATSKGVKPVAFSFHTMLGFNATSGTYQHLAFYISGDIAKSKLDKVRGCPNAKLPPNGKPIVEFEFSNTSNGFMPESVECLYPLLPASASNQLKFLAEHFKDLASAMVETGTIKTIGNENLRTFVQKVASGEVRVGTK